MSKIVIFCIIFLILGLLFLSDFKEKENPPELNKSMIEEIETELETIPEEGKEKISIITIYDNYLSAEALAKAGQVDPCLKTGWGFSCLVRRSLGEGGLNILFDTGGDSATLLSNMEKMEIDPKEIDIIVLSHIHGDHTGGLEGILKINSNLKVFLPQSFPDSFKETIRDYEAEIVEVKNSTKISGGIFSTGELGTWIKEQSLVINTDKGLIVITGCAHPGIVNIVKKAKELLNKNIYLVLGGFHLSGASDSELEEIIKDFRELGVQKVAPCHCSGDRCRELFKQEYKENFIENGVGKIIEI